KAASFSIDWAHSRILQQSPFAKADPMRLAFWSPCGGFSRASRKHRRSNVTAENNTVDRNRRANGLGLTRIGREDSRSHACIAAPGTSRENRGRGELPSAALWHRDVHYRFVRRPPFGIRCGGIAGTPG